MICPISHILKCSETLCTGDKSQIMSSLTEEAGELATEVLIDLGHKARMPGKDGIIGEAVDVIVTAVDMIYAANPGITIEEIHKMVVAKCAKWAVGVAKLKNK